MGANKSKVQNKSEKIQNNEQNTFQHNSYIQNIKSKYILKKIFDNINKERVLKLINYNKNIQNKLEIGLNDYKNEFMKVIKIEIFIKNNIRKGKFINYIVDENKYHIYFDEETNERNINCLSNENWAKNVKIVLNIEGISLKGLFKDCECIEKINFIKFNKDDIIDMSYMFYGCLSLNEVNLSNLLTNKVKDMSFMFYKCQSLTELDLSKFNIQKN